MDFGFVIPAFGTVATASAMAQLIDAGEQLGYDGIWFGDHVVVPSYATAFTDPDWLDPVICAAMGMARTSRLRFGTDVLVAPYRHPALIAKMGATAAALGGSRLVLGFGVGYLRGEFAILGLNPDERGAITDEYLAAIRALWDGDGPVQYHGQHVSFDDAVFGPKPSAGLPPLWVGGNAPAALRRAARFGDGWHPLFPTPEQYATGRATILTERGDAAGPFSFSYSSGFTRVMDASPGAYDPGAWSSHGDLPDDFGYAPPMPVAADGRLRFSGTPDDIATDIDAYAAAGVEHVVLRFSYGGADSNVDDFLDQLARFAAEVMPRYE